MLKTIMIVSLMFLSHWLISQWTGDYHGTINGDNVVMSLNQSGNQISGTMKDSYQTYQIKGEANGNRMAGDAVESTLGLTFALLAEKNNDLVNCKLVINLLGQESITDFVVTKQGSKPTISTSSVAKPSSIPFPSNATFSSSLVGRWTKEEIYNSGSGANFMGGNFSQSMVFLANGGMSDGGSSATMSGSNYYGQSSGDGGGLLQEVGWYNIGNQLYLMIFQNGQWQSAQLGKWYTENNKLLITGTNGEKLLLSR